LAALVLPATNLPAARRVPTTRVAGRDRPTRFAAVRGPPTAFGGPARPSRSVPAERVPPRTLRGQGSLRAHECSLRLRRPLDRSRPGAARRQCQPRWG
jgi:hypothetical protein